VQTASFCRWRATLRQCADADRRVPRVFEWKPTRHVKPGELRASHQRAEHDRPAVERPQPNPVADAHRSGTSTMTLNGATSPAARTSRDPTVRASSRWPVAANGINFLLDGVTTTTHSATSICRSRSRFHPGIQRADQRPAGAVRIASRRCGQHCDQIGSERLPRRPVRLSAQRRLTPGRKAPQPRNPSATP